MSNHPKSKFRGDWRRVPSSVGSTNPVRYQSNMYIPPPTNPYRKQVVPSGSSAGSSGSKPPFVQRQHGGDREMVGNWPRQGGVAGDGGASAQGLGHPQMILGATEDKPVSEFLMSSDDFPALPRTAHPGPTAHGTAKADDVVTNNNHNSSEMVSTEQGGSTDQPPVKAERGIIFLADGTVTNIPERMVQDQYGIAGLLSTLMRCTTYDTVSLSLGSDLRNLGLDLNSTESLLPTFGGPWGQGPVKAEDIEWPVLPEYNFNDQRVQGNDFVMFIKEKLSPLQMDLFSVDQLFYLFYTYVGDVLQIRAAAELYNRDWRYHMEAKIWLTRVPGVNAIESNEYFERGIYTAFDPISWGNVQREILVEYNKLEDRPFVPPHFLESYLIP